MTDLSDWYPEPEAAQLLGVSVKTLGRMAVDGKGPERRQRPRPGRKPEWVYNRQDVDAAVAAKNPPRVMPPAGNALATTTDGELTPGARELLAILERMTTAMAQVSAEWLRLLRESNQLPAVVRRPSPSTGRPPQLLTDLLKRVERLEGRAKRKGRAPLDRAFPPAEQQILDDIARGMAGRPYARLNAADQATVRTIAERMAAASGAS